MICAMLSPSVTRVVMTSSRNWSALYKREMTLLNQPRCVHYHFGFATIFVSLPLSTNLRIDYVVLPCSFTCF